MQPYRYPDHQVSGDADTTVFLLHGAYGSKAYFEYETATLVRAGYRVVAWDAPGYALSPLPAQGLSIERLADTAASLVEREGTARNVVLGHSMGGIVAPGVAVRLPERVHGLVVSATVGSFSQKSEEDRRTFLAERVEPLKRGRTFEETAGAVVNAMFAPGSSGPMVDLVKRVALSTSASTFCSAIEAIVAYEGLPTLRQVRVPTLLIAGAHDTVGRPEGMRAMREFVPQAELVVIENAGHYAFAEQHEAFNRHLLAFLARIGQTARA
ncbi:alpha/beta fold hydrolase [Verticiella sediminum]|uniref:Alpha/beta fold hydrolase n=1 Tax=Verticiella sediminum TaxID=1247510 RepID=A0A556B066_9BURK|nr:alpha/beta fold hydrolase [Verticiella sediminum]TSH98564.1 alpha/beta fold hydrolase [Verticiella sediminum]